MVVFAFIKNKTWSFTCDIIHEILLDYMFIVGLISTTLIIHSKTYLKELMNEACYS